MRCCRVVEHFAAIARPGFDNAARTEVEFETGSDVDREAPRFDPAPGEIDLEVDSPPSRVRGAGR